MSGGAWDSTVRGPAGLGMGNGGVYSPSAVLFFPVFNDQGGGVETTILLTNTHTSTVYARWFFFSKVAQSAITHGMLTLTAGETITILASVLANALPGALMIVAVDVNGAPVSTNKFTATCNYVASGYDVTYSPICCRAIGNAGTLITWNGNAYDMNFDGVGYETLPKFFYADFASASTARLLLATIPPTFAAGIGLAFVNVALVNKITRKQIMYTFPVASYANQASIIIPVASVFGSLLTTDITTGGMLELYVWSKLAGIMAIVQTATGNGMTSSEIVNGRLPNAYDSLIMPLYPLPL